MLPSTITYHVLTDDQLAAQEERIVERVASIIADHWLPRRPMDLAETAEFFGVSVRTVRDWMAKGELGQWKHGQTVLCLPDQIAAFVASYRNDVDEAAVA